MPRIPLTAALTARSMKTLGKGLSWVAGNSHRWGWLPGDHKLETDLNVPYAGRGGKQSVDVYLPKEPLEPGRPHPWLFFIHGGGWVIGDRKMGAVTGRVLASRGIAVVSAGYRLAPRHGLADQIADVQAAMRFVHDNAGRWNLDTSRFGICGESAGAHLTLRLAQDFPEGLHPPCGIVAFYGLYEFGGFRRPRSFRHAMVSHVFMGALRRGEELEVFLNDHHALRPLPWTDVPVLLIHGDRDGLVSVGQTYKLAALLREQGVPTEVKVYPGVGHAFNYARRKNPHYAVDAFKTLGRFMVEKVVPAGDNGRAAARPKEARSAGSRPSAS